MNKILVNVMREEIRMAVVDEQGQLVDFVLERTDDTHIVNHMFKGTVKNVVPGMQAVFVDIGGTQNAYLNLQQGKQLKILRNVSVGQQVLVQVIKEEMLGKGARVTADVSLAGRFMVLLPYSEGMHISKKITDEALRNHLQTLAEPYVREGAGFIIRTAAEKATEEEIKRDMEYLWRTWQHVTKRFKVAKSGTDLYSDADFWFRLVRDYAHRNVSEIIIDSKQGVERLNDLLGVGPAASQIAVTLHHKSTPIFKANHIESQLEELISREVNLPSGGSIRIDHTEALTVFDVNSAHYTGHSNKAEDLAFTVNKEAAYEICRQLRLRDIGGIIVIDFIDMKMKEHQQQLVALLTQLAKQDKMKTVVCGISALGLVEMTRKRARQGLQSLMFDTCPQCGGTGYMLSGRTVYMQIVRRIRELFKAGRIKSNLEVEVHPEVGQYLTKAIVEDLGQSIGRTISVVINEQMSREGYSLMAVSE
ncbi:Rne/Rng family ribonuclease [Veillonella agrestimuris]|uniref:Rne/Rng family ribonuclease n=1 Tax=Veillonella agrestimuris TaxID=2941340 RepID=UPI00203BCDA9|nr:Rne/Rng family ribonuclease [Veillonella agrestimuris]